MMPWKNIWNAQHSSDKTLLIFETSNHNSHSYHSRRPSWNTVPTSQTPRNGIMRFCSSFKQCAAINLALCWRAISMKTCQLPAYSFWPYKVTSYLHFICKPLKNREIMQISHNPIHVVMAKNAPSLNYWRCSVRPLFQPFLDRCWKWQLADVVDTRVLSNQESTQVLQWSNLRKPRDWTCQPHWKRRWSECSRSWITEHASPRVINWSLNKFYNWFIAIRTWLCIQTERTLAVFNSCVKGAAIRSETQTQKIMVIRAVSYEKRPIILTGKFFLSFHSGDWTPVPTILCKLLQLQC